MTTFHLIRHGLSEWNETGRFQGQADVPLSETGHEQARRLAERLRADAVPFEAIYSSDLRRAWDTAVAVGRALDMGLFALPAVREIDVGTWSGKTRAEIGRHDPETIARLEAGEDVPRGGGERIADVAMRAIAALEDIAALYPHGPVAIVTHGGVIRSLLHHAYAAPGAPNGAMPALVLANTSISIVRRDPDGWHVVSVDDTRHLDEPPVAAPAGVPETAPRDDAQTGESRRTADDG